MLFPFFIIGAFLILMGCGSALVGWNITERRRVRSFGEYLFNYLPCAGEAALGLVIILAYTKLFGWPQPE